MRFQRPAPLHSLVAGLGLLVMTTSAATTAADAGPNLSSLVASESAAEATTAPTSTAKNTDSAAATNTDSAAATNTHSAAQSNTDSAAPTNTDSAAPSNTAATNTHSASATASETGKTNSKGPTTTASETSVSANPTITGGISSSLSGNIPTITGTNTNTKSAGVPTNLPTLSGAFTIVAPSVPPTADAPYMHQSSAPEGTIFIIAGAIIGFFALAVIAWRALMAYSLHQSIKRAAMLQNMPDSKAALFTTPVAPFYQYKDRESTISLAGLGPKSGKKGPPRPPAGAGAAPLFFSPTAGAGGIPNPGNRGSNYLPAGYYAAGASQLGNGQGMAHIGSGNSISLSNLGPTRDGYGRARSVGTSEPGSPYMNAAQSSSTLNLSQPMGDRRAPSVYLDDLFDSENAPPVPGHARNPSAPRNSARF